MKNLIKEIVAGIIESADELHANKERDLVQQGELIGYAESLSIIRDALAGQNLAEYDLDFDIDGKYLLN